MSSKYLQYFTDPAIVELALKPISRDKVHTIIDPAVGNGVFLRQCKQIWPKALIFGVDLDRGLVEKLRSEFAFSGRVIAGNSLHNDTFHKGKMRRIMQQGGFDLVVGNPPFSRQGIRDQPLLRTFQIVGPPGKRIYPNQPYEVLFVEQFLKLCKPGGYVIIVLPNGLLCNPRDAHIRKFILERADILEILNIPASIFNGTDARTAGLILRKKASVSGRIISKIVKLRNLEKGSSGLSLNGTISIRQPKLLKRMDYDYYNPSPIGDVDPQHTNAIIKPLADLVRYIAVGHTQYGANRRFSRKGGLKYISSKSVTATGINFCKELKYVSPGTAMDSVTAHVKRHDLLFVRVGDGCLGKVTVVRGRGDIGIVNDCIFIIRIKSISPYYIALILQAGFGKQWIQRLSQHSTGARSISKKSLLECPIPVLLDKRFREKLVRKYQRYVLDLHLKGQAKGLRGDKVKYGEINLKAKQNLLKILNSLDSTIERVGGFRNNKRGRESLFQRVSTPPLVSLSRASRLSQLGPSAELRSKPF